MIYVSNLLNYLYGHSNLVSSSNLMMVDGANFSGIYCWSDLVRLVCDYLHTSGSFSSQLSMVIPLIFLGLSIIVVLKSKISEWKIITLICCNLILSVGLPRTYSSLYMVIALCFMLKQCCDRRNIPYVLLMCWMLCLPFFPIGSADYLMTIKTASTMILSIAILAEGLYNLQIFRSQNNNGSDGANGQGTS